MIVGNSYTDLRQKLMSLNGNLRVLDLGRFFEAEKIAFVISRDFLVNDGLACQP